MTDNRTTELLREGLTEHGIEWRSGLEGVTFVGDWCFVEYDNGKLAATCEPVLTPEQAIAAWNSRADYHGYEQAAIEAWENIKAWNTRAERTCHRVDVNGYSFRFECSACGYVAIVHNCSVRLDELPNYCPNCGARVVE